MPQTVFQGKLNFTARLCYNIKRKGISLSVQLKNANLVSDHKEIMKTLYVTDLDGTLLTKEERISEYSLAKLNSLVDRGLLFTYATARSTLSAERATQGLKLNIPAVLYNGGLIYDRTTDTPLYASFFEEADKRYVLQVLRSFGICPFIYGATREREHIKWMPERATEGMNRYLSRRVGDNRLIPVHTDDDLLDGYVFYFKCIGPGDQIGEAWNALKYDQRFVCIYHQEMYQNDFWMEISTKGANKAKGVLFLKDYLKCDKVVCFGDTSNDSDMFDVCDEKYAVKNADEWLKEKATGVIGYCEEDGVAKWLEENFRPEP